MIRKLRSGEYRLIPEKWTRRPAGGARSKIPPSV